MNFEQSVPVGLTAVKDQKDKNSHKGKRKSSTTTKSSLKVVYISSPMKVKTSASDFRSLVQELTGKNSDISRYMADDDNSGGDFREMDFFGRNGWSEKEPSEGSRKLSPSVSAEGSHSFSGTPVVDSVFVNQMKERFGEIFPADSFYDPSQMDVLGSFDELL